MKEVEVKAESEVRMPRVSIDFKIPLWGVMGALAVALLFAVNMWVTLMSVSDKATAMQATLTQVVNTNTQLISDQALLKYRVDKLEARDAREAAAK